MAALVPIAVGRLAYGRGVETAQPAPPRRDGLLGGAVDQAVVSTSLHMNHAPPLLPLGTK